VKRSTVVSIVAGVIVAVLAWLVAPGNFSLRLTLFGFYLLGTLSGWIQGLLDHDDGELS
jgi:hypothetical protein